MKSGEVRDWTGVVEGFHLQVYIKNMSLYAQHQKKPTVGIQSSKNMSVCCQCSRLAQSLISPKQQSKHF